MELPLEFGRVPCTGIIGTSNYLEVSVSPEDSAISHPRDQDYLSLWVGKGSEVDLQQALACMVANLRKREREEKGKARLRIYDQEVILDYLRSSITRDRVLFPDSTEKRPSRLHTLLIHFN